MDIMKQRISDYTSRVLSQGRNNRKSSQTCHTQNRGGLGASSNSLIVQADSEGPGSRLPTELLLVIFVKLPRLVDILTCRRVRVSRHLA
jgi:hypothetical protein